MTQKQTPHHTPPLRFPEFRGAGAWAVKKLGEVCDKTFSGGTPSTSKKDYYSGSIPFIRSAEIDKEKTELFLSEEGLANSSAKLIKKGDVLFALYGANSGNVAVAKLDGAINQAIICLQSKGKNQFIYQYLLYINGYIVSNYIQGGQGNLSGNIVKSIKIPLPPPAEQEKIAECLLSLDEVITAQGDRLDGLKDYKRGLMQQLFPAKGQTTPTLRFREFQGKDSWQSTKLGEAFNLYQPKTLSRTALNQNGKYNVYGANGIIGRHNKYNHRNSEVIVTCRGATCGEIHYTEPKVWITGNAMVVNPKDNNLSKRFILYYLKNRDFKHVISGSAQPQITREGFAPLPIALPPLAEQEKIADCLHSVDESITIQEQQLELLKKHKNGLMQQLFPTH